MTVTIKFMGFSIACHNPDCQCEFSFIDDIDGTLVAEDIRFCPICGEEL